MDMYVLLFGFLEYFPHPGFGPKVLFYGENTKML